MLLPTALSRLPPSYRVLIWRVFNNLPQLSDVQTSLDVKVILSVNPPPIPGPWALLSSLLPRPNSPSLREQTGRHAVYPPFTLGSLSSISSWWRACKAPHSTLCTQGLWESSQMTSGVNRTGFQGFLEVILKGIFAATKTEATCLKWFHYSFRAFAASHSNGQS